MDELFAMRIFVQVVEQGSFSAVARQLHSSTSSIARQVQALENALGTKLLTKTTRQQGLTEAGRTLFERAKVILEDLERAKRDVSAFQNDVRGLLRVYLRVSAGEEVIVPSLPRFLARFPGVNVDVVLGDERIDLVAHSIDVAVWLGHLEDSTMNARRLSTSRRVLCGSPAYFKTRGIPTQPSNLDRHNCLLFRANRYRNVWRFTKDGEFVDIAVSGNLQTSSSSVLRASALQGLGLIVSQSWMVAGDIAHGRLRTVLSDYEVTPTDFDASLYAVYPHGRGSPPKVRAFVDFLVDLFSKLD